MSSDFNVLSYLGVTTSVEPCRSSTAPTSFQILTPTQKAPGNNNTKAAPKPSRAASSAAPALRAQSAGIVAQTPRPKASEAAQSPSRHVEIYEGSCPSNLAVNRDIVEHRRTLRQVDKKQETLLAQAQFELDRKRAEEEFRQRQIQKGVIQDDWNRYIMSVHEARQKHKRELDAQRELERKQAEAAQAVSVVDQQHQRDAKFALAHQLRDQLQHEITRKAAIRREELEFERQRLYNATLVDAQGIQRDVEAERHTQAVLKTAWEAQHRIRAEQRQAQQMAERELIATTRQIAAENVELERAERQRQKAQKIALRDDLRRAMLNRAHDRVSERAAQREHERKEQEALLRTVAEQESVRRQAETGQKLDLRHEIERQLEEKSQARLRRGKEAGSPHSTVIEAESKILVRCPATGRLLPPEYFNLTPSSVRRTLKRLS